MGGWEGRSERGSLVRREDGLLFPPPHEASGASPLSQPPRTISLQMALSAMAFGGGAAGAHGQRPVPRTRGELTRLL